MASEDGLGGVGAAGGVVHPKPKTLIPRGAKGFGYEFKY